MRKYVTIIKDDIKRFIKNYLIAGKLVDVTGLSNLEEYVPSKFPYLSILYLLKQNGLNEDETWFVENYNSQLLKETSEVKKILGYFLWNKNDVDELTAAERFEYKNRVSSLSQEIEKLRTQKERLEEDIIRLTSDINSLKDNNRKLEKKARFLEVKLSDSQNSTKAIVKSSHQDSQKPEETPLFSIEELIRNVIKDAVKYNDKVPPSTSSSNECNDIFDKTSPTEKKYRWQTDTFYRIIKNDTIRREEEQKRIQEEKEREEMKEKFYRKLNKKR